MSDGKATILSVLAFVAVWWLTSDLWSLAVVHAWLPTNVIEAASMHADDIDDSPDDPRSFYAGMSVTLAFVLAFRVYRWARAGRLSGDLSPKEFALSTEVALGALAFGASSIAVSAVGLRTSIAGGLRLAAYTTIALVAWRAYPWLERKAPRRK